MISLCPNSLFPTDQSCPGSVFHCETLQKEDWTFSCELFPRDESCRKYRVKRWLDVNISKSVYRSTKIVNKLKCVSVLANQISEESDIIKKMFL